MCFWLGCGRILHAVRYFGGQEMTDALTTKEAAEILGYHPYHLRDLLRRGVIKASKFGQVWMIPREEVERIQALQGPTGRLPMRKRKD